MKFINVLAGAAIATASLSAPALAETKFRASSAFGPGHISAQMYDIFLTKVEEMTEGRYVGENFPSGLVAPPELLTALKSGIIDLANLPLPYFPAELPETNLPAELSLLTNDNVVAALTNAEYTFGCEACLAELSQYRGIYLSGVSTAPYQILSTRPVTSLEDMKGLKIRTGAAAQTRWASALGATPVQISSTEIFEALSQGVLDAHFASMEEYKTSQLNEVVKYVTQTNLAPFSGISPFTLSSELWKEMSKQDKENFFEAAQWGAAEFVIGFREREQAGVELAKQSGTELIEIGADIAAATEVFIEADLKKIEAALTSKGVVDAGVKIARYLELLAKWKDLAKGVETREDFVNLMTSEIISKIDLDSYGM